MHARQKNKINKFHIIIQARMSSKRLPGKVLRNLNGKPSLWHIYQRCLASKFANKVIVATTTDKSDDEVARFCKKFKIPFFRGSLDHVLSRYYKTAQLFNSNIIGRITADNPLIDPETIDRCFVSFIKQGCDYVSNVVPGEKTFPRGLDVEIFSFSALEKAFKEVSEDSEKEHVTPYIWQNKNRNYKIGKIVTAPKYLKESSSLRLTVDYPEDFALVDMIYEKFNNYKIIPTYKIINFLNNHPEIATVNSACEQKYHTHAPMNLLREKNRKSS